MEVLVWARSHRKSYPNTGKYYELSAAQLAALGCEPGDVLVMEGGRLAHGSPGVAEGHPIRWATYAYFDLV